MNWGEWPEAAVEERPKRLPHAGGMHQGDVAQVEAKGWRCVDVRQMSNETDAQRAEAVKAWLEGVRLGTIEADPKLLKFIELECRVYGLSAGKTPAEDRKKETKHKAADVRALLSFGTPLDKDKANDGIRQNRTRSKLQPE